MLAIADISHCNICGNESLCIPHDVHGNICSECHRLHDLVESGMVRKGSVLVTLTPDPDPQPFKMPTKEDIINLLKDEALSIESRLQDEVDEDAREIYL